MHKQSMQLKMLAVMASILLSGCGGKQVKESRTQIPQAPAFKQEDPKQFALSHKQDTHKPQDGVEHKLQDLSAEHVQSKLIDIPMPLATNIIFAHPAQERGVCVGFESTGTQIDIAEFFEREMELLGWYKRSSYASRETGFVFEKPNKTCIIVLRDKSDKRNKKNGSYITIFA